MFIETNNKKQKVRSLKGLFAGVLLSILALTVSTPAFAGRSEADKYLNDHLDDFSKNDQSSFYSCSFNFLPTPNPLGAYGYDPITAAKLKSELLQIFWNGIADFKSQALDRQALPGYFKTEVRATASSYSCSVNRDGKDHVQGLVDEMSWLFNDSLTLYFTLDAVVAKFLPSQSKAIVTALAKPTPQECFEAKLEDLMAPSGSLYSCYCVATYGGGCLEMSDLHDDLRQDLIKVFNDNGTLIDSRRNSWFEASAKLELSQKVVAPTLKNKYSCSDMDKTLTDITTKFNECAIPLTPPSPSTGGTNWAPPVDQKTGTIPNVIITSNSNPIGNTSLGNNQSAPSNESDGSGNNGSASSGCSIGMATDGQGSSLAFLIFLIPVLLLGVFRKVFVTKKELNSWFLGFELPPEDPMVY